MPPELGQYTVEWKVNVVDWQGRVEPNVPKTAGEFGVDRIHVDSVEIGEPVTSLQQVSSGRLLLEILYLIDNSYQAEKPEPNDGKATDWSQVISYLENFYQQPLTALIDQNEISRSNSLEIGKVLSLLLCCAVQGENVSFFVDKITRLDEDTQLRLKIIIEAVLKEVDSGKINIQNITKVLGQSEAPEDSQDYTSSPTINGGVSSPVLFYDSPIRALMASPQMRSRQSQTTISKLYKRMNQLQIKINTQQRTLSDMDQLLEEKNRQIHAQDLKIGSLSKEVAKIPGLEEEIQSLSCFEKELEEVKLERERLEKRTAELEIYKDQCLKLEKQFSVYAVERNEEKCVFDNRLKEMKTQYEEKIENLLASLEEKDANNNRIETKLSEASSMETTLKQNLCHLESSYKVKVGELKAALDELNKIKDELCQKKDRELLAQIARESDLKKCFKEKQTSLEVALDQLQLENSNLHRNVSIEKNLVKNLQSDLARKQQELEEIVRNSESLKADLKLLDCESKATINQLMNEKASINDTLQKTQAETVMVKDALKDLQKNNNILTEEKRQLMNKNDNIVDCFEQESRLLKEAREYIEQLERNIRNLNDTMVKEKNSLRQELDNHRIRMVSEKDRLKKDLEDKESELIRLQEFIAGKEEELSTGNMMKVELENRHRGLLVDIESDKQKLVEQLRENERLRSSLDALNEKNASLVEANLSLKEKVEEMQPLALTCEKLQSSFKVSSEEKASLMKENLALKEKLDELKLLSVECKDLQSFVKVLKEEKASVTEENRSLKTQLRELETLSEQYKKLQVSLKASSEEKISLVKANLVLRKKVEELIPQSVEYEKLYNLLKASSGEKASIMEENTTLKRKKGEQLEILTKDCSKLQNSLKISCGEKASLVEENSSPKETVRKLEPSSTNCDQLGNSLKVSSEENASRIGVLSHEEQPPELQYLSENCELLEISMKTSWENASLTKEILSLKEKVKQLEDLPEKCELLQVSLKSSCEDNALLQAENKSLCGEIKVITAKAIEDKETLVKENTLLKSKLPTLISSLNTLRGKLQEARDYHCGHREDMTRIQVYLKECCEKLVNEHTELGKELLVKEQNKLVELAQTESERGELAEDVNERNENNTKMEEEKVFEFEKLYEEIIHVRQENEKLKEIQGINEKNYVKERTKAGQLKVQFDESKDEIKKLNDESSGLKEEIMKLSTKLEFLQDENDKLSGYVPELEENVTSLEKKLVEEEFISKRLGVEVRSLEAQLLYADRQLRQRTMPKGACVNHRSEDTNRKQELRLSGSKTSIVSSDSIVPESKIAEVKGIRSSTSSNGNKNQDQEKGALKHEGNAERQPCDQRNVNRQLRRRSALYQTRNESTMEMSEERRSTVGGTFLMVNQFTTEDDEPTLFGCDYDWDRILELQKRNATCLPHMRSSYPVETQVRGKDEIHEEELRSGTSTSCLSRKRLRDNASDSSLSVTFHIPNDNKAQHNSALPRSKSDDRIGKRFSERLASKFNSQKSKNAEEHRTLLSSTFSFDQTTSSENDENFCRRESIAFNVDLSPPKKSRPTIHRGIHRSFGKSDLTLASVKNKKKEKLQSLKKFPLQRKPNDVKSDKKPLTSKTNYIA